MLEYSILYVQAKDKRKSQRIHQFVTFTGILSVILHFHLQGQMFAFISMEAVHRCVKANWDSPTAPVCHSTSYQLMEKAACLLMLQMEQQVIYFMLSWFTLVNYEVKLNNDKY